jgi:hypothetical protein
MTERGKKKPTGEIGHVHVRGRNVTFVPVSFPTTKPEIERFILDAALAERHWKPGMKKPTGKAFELRAHYGLKGEPIQNAESHFDFTLPTESGQTYLDLMEVALLREVGGSFAKATSRYCLGDRADALWAEVSRKSEGYGTGPSSGVHLLLYSTDYRFDLGQGVSALLIHMLHARTHCFRSVVYCVPNPDFTASVRLLHPLSEEKRGRLESEQWLRQITEIVLHPGSLVVIDGDERASTEQVQEPEPTS